MIHRLLAVATLTFVAGLPLAAQEEPMMSVEPNPATIDDPLLVTVDSDGFFCRLLDPVYLEDMVIVIGATVFCDDPPPPEPPPALFTLLPPLTAGVWRVELNAADLPVNYPLGILETLEVTVTDPRYTIELTPSPATEDDEVTAHLTYLTFISHCVSVEPPVVSPGRIRLELEEGQVCGGPPLPPGTYGLSLPIGQLEAGDYLADFYFDGSRVAESRLSVLPSGACATGYGTLCLNSGRFRVRARWTHPSMGEAPAAAVGETDDTGFFWFTTPDNIELVVKVLDACHTSFQSFWVFAAGLTNLGVELTVTDTVTGTSVTYENPPGTPFELIADTAAFATCP